VSAPLTRLGVPKLWHEDRARLWRFARRTVVPVTLRLAPSAAYGVDRIPHDRGCVLAANHFSGIDHPLIGAFVPGMTYFLAKSELFEIPVLGEALVWMGVISIRRGESDRDALRSAREHVRNGDVVCVHIEGTRQRLGLDTFGWSVTNRRKCALVFGEPIDLDHLPRNRAGYAEAGELVREEMVRLWRLAAQAAAAGLPPALPDGTPRNEPVSD
jgi:1-acyl-sn-glycerol-3-phosphate acyltransferase